VDHKSLKKVLEVFLMVKEWKQQLIHLYLHKIF